MTIDEDGEDEPIIELRPTINTRHKFTDPYEGALDGPRLGRRESEPHSSEINYLWDVLTTNFPQHRVFWDLTHYFNDDGSKITIQFDVSFFLDLKIPEKIPSFDSTLYNARIPSIAINILSKSTWRKDFADNLEKCRKLRIPNYVVFFAYPIKNEAYPYPFLRCYHLNQNGEYDIFNLLEITYEQDHFVNEHAIIDCDPNLPFRIGLAKIDEKFLGGKPLYRMILLKRNKIEKFLTKAESSEFQAKLAKDEAKLAKDEVKLAKDEVKLAKDEVKLAKDEAKLAKDEAEKERKRADELEQKLKELNRK